MYRFGFFGPDIPLTGSTVTRLEDLCLDEGSQYDLNLALGEGGSGPLLVRDLVIVEPVEPEKAFPGQLDV